MEDIEDIVDGNEVEESVIEKPKTKKPHGLTGRPMTEIQKANLQKGRDVRKANKDAKDKVKEDEAYHKVKAQVESVPKKAEQNQTEKKSKKAKQVIVIQSDSDSDDDAPQIIIRHKKKPVKQLPAPEPVIPQAEPEYFFEPEPRIKLRRV